jgi:hypothetical protein
MKKKKSFTGVEMQSASIGNGADHVILVLHLPRDHVREYLKVAVRVGRKAFQGRNAILNAVSFVSYIGSSMSCCMRSDDAAMQYWAGTSFRTRSDPQLSRFGL